MKAIIPHKDTAFALGKVSKICLNVAKSYFEAENLFDFYIFPKLPLWIIEENLPESSAIKALKIDAPIFCQNALFFPSSILLNDKAIFETRITFGTLCCTSGEAPKSERSEYEVSGLIKKTLSQKEDFCFPLSQRVFRTGDIRFFNNSWEFYNEKWVKLPSARPF